MYIEIPTTQVLSVCKIKLVNKSIPCTSKLLVGSKIYIGEVVNIYFNHQEAIHQIQQLGQMQAKVWKDSLMKEVLSSYLK